MNSSMTGGFDANIAFIICLVLGVVFLALAVLFFFLFDIPRVYLIRTGKGAKKTIKKMEEINAETGRLRKVNEEYMLNSDVAITGETGPVQSAESAGAGATTVLDGSTGAPQAPSGEGGNLTTVLGQNETTLLSNSNETTVLSGDLLVGGATNEYVYTRETSGRFDITFNLMMVHSDEII